ncbi:MAG: hypothetical protein IKR19_07445 [Acholeplasmatales bacterium]|nr:hypothetical protein [Acholeplasmatales bacterium]
MGSSLVSNFREKVSKIKDAGINRSAEFDVQYSTGFLGLDYLNGTVVHVQSEDRSFTYNSLGIVDGSANTIIGRSNSGKSTFTIQVIGNIIRPFIKKGLPTGIFIDDIEGSLPMVRKAFLLEFSEKELEEYVDVRNTGITTENVMQRIKALHDEKVNNRKKYEYDTGLFDVYGNKIYKLIPTIYMIDSLPMLLPKDLTEEEELGGSMSASSIAKSNTMLSKQIIQLCKESGIILFTINHILDEIQMGFIPKAAQIAGLKQGERLPGGKAAMYLANNMFRLDDSTMLKASEGFGIDGSIVSLTIIKSRTNATRRSIPLIFNKSEGKFDDTLSLFQLLKNEGVFKGAGSYQYVDGCEDIKFSQKTFKEVLSTSPELQKAFASECLKVLKGLLSDTKVQTGEFNTVHDNIVDIINQLSNGELVG